MDFSVIWISRITVAIFSDEEIPKTSLLTTAPPTKVVRFTKLKHKS